MDAKQVKTAVAAAEAEAQGRGIGSWINSTLEIAFVVALGAALYFGLFQGMSAGQAAMAIVYIGVVIFGIGLLVFVHELGHFLAAKFCGVKVEAFSIGIGRAIPGCKVQWGETVYKLAIFPIGGYVKMLGQADPGENEDDPEGAQNSPRSFLNKSVGQRLFIISAGVIMNLLLGFLIFIYIYMVGKQEPAPFFGHIEPGSPADRAGLRASSQLIRVNDETNPSYEDLFYASLLSRPGRTQIQLAWRTPDGQEQSATVVPRKLEEDTKPSIGVGFPAGLVLFRGEKPDTSPATKGTPAAAVPFRAGDQIVAVRPEGAEAFRPMKHGVDLIWAQYEFRKKPLEVKVERGADGEEVVLTVPPAHYRTFGFRVAMGPIVVAVPAKMPPSAQALKEGDQIVALNGQRELDLLRLADQIMDLAEADQPITLTIQRDGQEQDVKIEPGELRGRGTWFESVSARSAAPVAIPALGIAIQPTTTVAGIEPGSAAERLGLTPGAKLLSARLSYPDSDRVEKREFGDRFFWSALFFSLQMVPTAELELTFADASGASRTIQLPGAPDPTWFLPERGFKLENEFRTRTAAGIGEAIALGFRDTYRFLGRIYVNLYSFVAGHISPKLLSGPIMMVTTTYQFVERGLNEFLMFLAMISINLAVVNFLPIPVLDGGHAVLLIAEKIRGKPINERILYIVTLGGLAFVICLMLFVTFMDLTKFAWFQRLFGMD
ncbi:MAG TPA: site-2 protease family protein [Gemmatales bacterium]|nr:site-2 protease family protein [Gemmatales bacterium]HMP57837.1 site-2 protease family protein [Gemmatales bacterium]